MGLLLNSGHLEDWCSPLMPEYQLNLQFLEKHVGQEDEG